MKGFWAIPKSMAKRKDLSFKAKLVAGILWTRKNSDFEAFPSRRYMAEALAVSTDTIDRALKELKDRAGLRVKRKGLGRNNRYCFPDWDESAELPIPESATLRSQESANLPTLNIRESNKDNTYVDDKDHPAVKEIFLYFKNKVNELKGFEPEISWAKEGRLVKLRLGKYSPEQLKELMDWYLNSRFSGSLGISLAACLSAHIINLWKSETASQPLYPIWKPPDP